MTQTGRCLCGAVSFSAEEVKPTYSACHCGMCRKWCGGAPYFSAQTRNVVFAGDEHIARYTSSEWAERGFCRTCGTTLFYFFKPMKIYALAIGAFDDPSAFRLTREIFVDNKPEGYAFAGDHPRLTEAETLALFKSS